MQPITQKTSMISHLFANCKTCHCLGYTPVFIMWENVCCRLGRWPTLDRCAVAMCSEGWPMLGVQASTWARRAGPATFWANGFGLRYRVRGSGPYPRCSVAGLGMDFFLALSAGDPKKREAKFFRLTTLFFALSGAGLVGAGSGCCDFSGELWYGLAPLLKLCFCERATFSSKSLGSRSESPSLFCSLYAGSPAW